MGVLEEAGIDLRGLTLVVATGAWLAGILLASWLSLPPLVFMSATGIALLLLLLLWQNSRGRFVALFALAILLGAWRCSLASPLNDPQSIAAAIGPARVEVRGTVADEPKLVGRSRLLLITVEGLSYNQGVSWRHADGQVELQTLGTAIENPYTANYGDSIQAQGRLQPPRPHSPPNALASMAFPRVSVSGSGGNPVLAALYHLRVMLAAALAQSLPQPEAALLIAVLLGLRTPALKPLISAFNVTGTAHLVVPSGFKVTILAGLASSSTRWLSSSREPRESGLLLPAQKQRGNWRRWLATSVVIACIAAYTVLSGAGPAAMRAGVMGILLVVAPRLGRIYNVYTALAFVALLMSLLDPFVLWDPGFQLSLLGTLGIVLLTPFFQRLFRPIERLPSGRHLAEIAAVTLAAQTATLPIFALTFNQVSFIAPIANMLTVPLLEAMILLGVAICGAGLFLPLAASICGWAAWPVLWYVIAIVSWCASIPGGYLPTNGLPIDAGLGWGYYGLLGLLAIFLLRRWPLSHQHAVVQPRQTRRTLRILQIGAALAIILATGATALAAQTDGRLSITFLSIEPAGQAAQGEAILIRTADGKSALIDGGMDATSLSQVLDSHLPFWQRSLDMVMLTTPRQDHVAGLQDIVNRFQVGEVLDAGMLHPNAGYALWRRTLTERNLFYTQTRQGATIALGAHVILQILWPPSPLHKGGNEALDNGLIIHLTAPGLRILLLGIAAMSTHALNGLLTDIAPDYLQADIVQIVGEINKSFPPDLDTVLRESRPSLLVVTPPVLSAKQRKAGETPILALPPRLSSEITGQIVQTTQTGTLEVTSDGNRWDLQQ